MHVFFFFLAVVGISHRGGISCRQGGDPLKPNRRGQTPAMFAALTGRVEVLQWLLENTKNVADVLDSGTVRNPNEMVSLVATCMAKMTKNTGLGSGCVSVGRAYLSWFWG